MVRISNRNLEDEFIHEFITDLKVDLTARGLSKATIKFTNRNYMFTDHELLRGENLTVDIFGGWAETRMFKWGTFYAAVPRYMFRNTASPFINLTCYGQEWPLALSEERRVYENRRDSEIAELIARRNRLRTDIEQTDAVYEHVAQVAMTDMEFLENRSLLYGYDVYVENGVLHFHKPRLARSPTTLFFSGGERGVLEKFDVTVDPWVKGSRWVKSGIDRITGEEWELTSDGALDAAAQGIVSTGGRGFKRGSAISGVDGVQPTRHIIGDGHDLSVEEARAQVDGYAKASEWVTVASAKLRGLEFMQPRESVKIVGAGHLSGEYYVTRVVHTINARSGFSTKFEVTRPGVGRLNDIYRPRVQTGAKRRDVSGDSATVGQASIQ